MKERFVSEILGIVALCGSKGVFVGQFTKKATCVVNKKEMLSI